MGVAEAEQSAHPAGPPSAARRAANLAGTILPLVGFVVAFVGTRLDLLVGTRRFHALIAVVAFGTVNEFGLGVSALYSKINAVVPQL